MPDDDLRDPTPERDEPPKFRHTDVDGDRLLITTANIPGQGAGVYFRTDRSGSSVPCDQIDELIEQLRHIADAARDAVARKELTGA